MPILEGAEPFRHHGDGRTGALLLHGFTGNPSSLRAQAEAVAAAGHHVELPRLPGHGTVIDDMLATDWDDWTAEVDGAYRQLAERADRIVVGGQSMGGALSLWAARRHREIAGLVCVNPVTTPQPDDVVELIEGMLDDGVTVAPAVGGDLADPDQTESAYAGTPLRQALSMSDGIRAMTDHYGDLRMPMLLFTSRQDHVVDVAHSEHLAATYGGDVDHVWLERSYHVATQDYDRDLINARMVEFIGHVTGARPTSS